MMTSKSWIVLMVAFVALMALGSLQGAQADACFSSSALNFTSERGGLYVNGNRLRLKGASWSGFETSQNVAHGLWSKSYTFFLDFLANNGFNAVRLPFHLSLAINDASPGSIDYSANSDLQGLSSLQILDKIIQAAASRGLLVMLDLHSFSPDSFTSDGLWYNAANPESKVISGWTKILQRYKDQWNVFAADLKNEPYSATWGDGSATDWAKGSARLANAIATSVSDRFLMFVEGTANSPSCSDACFYGEDLVGVRSNPVMITHPWKLVYSPHVYGPNVYGQPYFSAGNFPVNMPAIWEAHWGYIASSTGQAVVVGEWGGPYSGKDATFMEALVGYLKSKDMTDQFFWCLNPNSGDTGGLLADDWSSPVTSKLSMLSNLVSSPTQFSVNSAGQVCVSGATTAASPSPSSSPKASASSSPSPKVSATSSPSPSSSPMVIAASPSNSPKVVAASTTPSPLPASPSSSPKVVAVSPSNSPKAVAVSATPSPSPATASEDCSVTVEQIQSNSWSAGVQAYSQWSVRLVAGSSAGVKSVTLNLAGDIDQVWGLTAQDDDDDGSSFGLPSYLDWSGGIAAGTAYEFGYIIKSAAQADVSIKAKSCGEAPSPASSPAPAASSSPAASPSPVVSSSPAASPVMSASPLPSPDSNTNSFTFQSGSSAWWMAVTIPGSTSVRIDCGNGQGLVDMTAGWETSMWTFSTSNGLPCASSLQFVVNGGSVQTVPAPY